MLMRSECVVCILNQIIRTGEYLELDPKVCENIFKSSLKKSYESDYSELTPPVFSEKVYKVLTDFTGILDPYKKLRKEQNDLILNNIDFFREKINNSKDPFFTSVFYSLLGNVIDYGGVEIFNTDQIFKDIKGLEPTINDYKILIEDLKKSELLLIISDNAGEAVFDMLFMEQIKLKYPEINIVYGVRSGPAINDIIKEDAEYIGIGDFAEIVETGSTYAGTVIGDSDKRFIEIYNSSDIVISKGQGNYETLETEKGKDIFFIFKVKCKIVAEHSGLPLNSFVMGYKSSFKK